MAADPEINDRTVVERRDPLLGQIFDRRFRIEAKIAAGGFGAIYRVTHVRSGHAFALKVLHPNLTADPRVVARFRREGAALTQLRDPHTITAYELGESADGTLYILMELLRGESLYDRFRHQGALPWRPVLALARAVCSSLSEAHALGIIHRDLKPTNIHLEPGDADVEFIKVLDFGIAKILQDSASNIDNTELTHAGQMIGTLDYMSPEQMVGGECGPPSDIYTLGVVMYEMIAGQKPFDNHGSAAAALAAMLTTTPPALSTVAHVPLDVDHLVMRCLKREHTERFQTADALAAALDELLTGEEQVTSIAVVQRSAGTVTRTAVLTPPPVVVNHPTAPVALPPPQLDSTTLVGHEPVARLPAGPVSRPMAAVIPRAPADPRPPHVIAAATTTKRNPPPAVSASQPMAAMSSSSPTIAVPPLRLSGSQDAVDPALEATQEDHTEYDRRISAMHAARPAPRPAPRPTGTPHIPALDDGDDHDGSLSSDEIPLREPRHITAARRALTPPTGMSTLHSITQAPTPSAVRRAARPIVSLHSGSFQLPKPPAVAPAAAPVSSNLREAYPTIHRQPPSPTRPPALDERSAAMAAVRPFDMASSVRRNAQVRLIAIAVGVLVAVLIGLLVASRL
ncbi:MAG TPA: serine/threonine-protein kinase [Kofleriaceae bacterium]|nr:serine/threonine-protein kinase [Kofleriaceae bacterium]